MTATASLEQAEADLETAYVRAPSDGKILKLKLRPGERIGQESLLEMGATDSMMALIEVYETEVRKINVGQQVLVTSPALEQPLQGVVESISQIVQRQELVDSTPAALTDARVVEVWVALDLPSSTLASGFVRLQVRAEFLP